MKANIDLLNIKSLKEEIRIIEQNAKEKKYLEQMENKVKFVNTIIQHCAKEMTEDFN